MVCGVLSYSHTRARLAPPLGMPLVGGSIPGPGISTTNLAARVRACVCVCVCVCVFAKLDKFLPVRSHFDTKRPVKFFHIATFLWTAFCVPLSFVQVASATATRYGLSRGLLGL